VEKTPTKELNIDKAMLDAEKNIIKNLKSNNVIQTSKLIDDAKKSIKANECSKKESWIVGLDAYSIINTNSQLSGYIPVALQFACSKR
jgi:hypothetical protein